MRSRPLAFDDQGSGNRIRHKRRLLLAIFLIGLLAGCALLRPVGSWVELTHEADAEPLSEAIVAFVADSQNEPGATIALAAVPEVQAANPLTQRVREKLMARGYQLSEPEGADGAALTYVVSRYGKQVLLRASFRQTAVSVLFARDGNGALRASAPLARREKGKVL